jgi:L-lactate utilization protein LutC
MKTWSAPAAGEAVERAEESLAAHGIEVHRAATATEARVKVLALIPSGAEVFTMTSQTLEETGIAKAINESKSFRSVRAALGAMDLKTQGRDMRRLGACPDVAVGSAHAVTETGTVMVASNTGSQLPAYAYGAGSVIWVVGTQKIVKDVEEGLRRINEYVVGLESVRARKAYGLPESWSSFPSKILLINREIVPGRAKIVLVEEVLGF